MTVVFLVVCFRSKADPRPIQGQRNPRKVSEKKMSRKDTSFPDQIFPTLFLPWVDWCWVYDSRRFQCYFSTVFPTQQRLEENANTQFSFFFSHRYFVMSVTPYNKGRDEDKMK